MISLLRPEVLESLLSLALKAPQGAIVEVGVYQGGSALHLAQAARRKGVPLFLYDTFTGMPYHQEGLDGNKTGAFADTSIEAVQRLIPDAILVPGVFPHSLIDMPPIGFVHADADQYDSTKAILDHLLPLMVDGGIVVFDDYGVPGCDGCTRAVDEWGGELQFQAGKAYHEVRR